MKDLYVVNCCRTAIGSFGGSLKNTPATEMGAIVVKEALKRANVAPENVDELMFGCILTAGLGQNVARQVSVTLGNLISRRCGNVPVALENDAKCAALAEVWIGNAKDCKDACVLVFGTGIGGGIIIDRKVRHGVGMIAGEMSFLYDGLPIEDVDKIRPLEEINSKQGGELPDPCIWTQQASVQALRRKVAKAKGLKWQEVNGEDIYEMAETDPEIQDILERMYYNIAWHCCNLYITLAPEIILIGGGISAQPKFMEGIIKYTSKLRRLSYIYERMKIDLCKFGNDSNLIGALFNFMQKYDLAK